MNDYVAYITDCLSPFGPIRIRSMFGGYGVYKDNAIVGIIVEGELYFKVSPLTIPEYEAYGSVPFTYDRDGKTIAMSYWRVPEEVMEDDELLRIFFKKAYEVSLATKKPARKKF